MISLRKFCGLSKISDSQSRYSSHIFQEEEPPYEWTQDFRREASLQDKEVRLHTYFAIHLQIDLRHVRNQDHCSVGDIIESLSISPFIFGFISGMSGIRITLQEKGGMPNIPYLAIHFQFQSTCLECSNLS